MAANVETMFSVREKPWHGLGVVVEDAPSSKDALNLAGLDWRVVQKPLFTNSGLYLLSPQSGAPTPAIWTRIW